MSLEVKARIFARQNRKWWTLGALSLPLFMIMLDNTVVNVALPSIQRDLGASLSQLQWTVNAYALTFAVLLLTGGKLADFIGRRRIFLIGLAIFTTASLFCGLATSGEWLIAARATQGVGAALMMPATLSIISSTFAPRERGLAIGIWAGVSGMALAIGPLVGGLITENINWNWVFYVNVPVGVLGFIAGRLVVGESKDESADQRLDVPGLIVSAIAIFALTFALVEANNYGWTSAVILGLFVIATLAFAGFAWLELHQRSPMLDLRLFKSGTFSGANTVALLVTFSMFGVFFFMSLYLQRILGYSPVEAGATFLPMTILIILIAPLAGKLSDRIGSRWLMAGGMTLVAIMLLSFSRISQDSGFWTLLPGLIIGGIGMAIVMTPMTAAALSAVPVDKAGMAAGVLNTSRQIGLALGVAVMGAIIASFTGDAAAGGTARAGAFLDGFTLALEISSGIALVGAVVAATTVRQARRLLPSRAGEEVAAA